MSSHCPTAADRHRVIRLDLRGDWRAYADPLPPAESPHDWRYFGVVTIDGSPGALAWRRGGFGFGSGSGLRELGMWDTIKIEALLEADPPGADGAPRFPDAAMATTGTFMPPRGG